MEILSDRPCWTESDNHGRRKQPYWITTWRRRPTFRKSGWRRMFVGPGRRDATEITVRERGR